MALRWNTDAQAQIIHGDEVVLPGESFDFTEDEASTLGDTWSSTDVRGGLKEEVTWKSKRNSAPAVETDSPAAAVDAEDTPAASGPTEE